MPLHHPSENLLAEFAAGTLPLAQAVAVKAHLHFCSECQQAVKKMESYGGSMLERLEPQPTMAGSFDQLMNTIDKTSEAQLATTVKATQPILNKSENQDSHADLPRLVRKLIKQRPLKWKRVNRSLKTAPLTVGQKQYQVSLQKIEAGNTAPEHDHRGTEITVVLEGSFSDKQGIYQKGDFLIKEPGDIHQPISARNQHCLCLSVEEAPVKLTGLWGRILNPFIKLHAA
ncbi:MAG: ChrR family anti-sigma-E factor [Cellvibrionaceae bacterium]